MSHQRIVPPARLAVDFKEVMEQANVSDQSQAALVQRLSSRAVWYVENYLERALITQTWELKLDRWTDPIFIPRPPFGTVTTFTYLDENGDSQALASSLYDEDNDSQPGRVARAYGTSWPSIRLVPNAITITHTAGYGDTPEDVPEPIRQAIALLVAEWYCHRELSADKQMAQLPFGFGALLSEYVSELVS